MAMDKDMMAEMKDLLPEEDYVELMKKTYEMEINPAISIEPSVIGPSIAPPTPTPAWEWGDDKVARLEREVKELKETVETLLEIMEHMQSERERTQATYGFKAGTGSVTANSIAIAA